MCSLPVRLSIVLSLLCLRWFALGASVLGGENVVDRSTDSQFLVGTATVDITPPAGYRMSGYFHERFSKGVKDPLLGKAVVFSQGNTLAALVLCDIIGLDREVSIHSRKLIEEQLGIPAANVSVAATHTHTGPLYWGALRDHFHHATVARNGVDPHEEFDYPKFLTEQIVSAVKLAKQELQAASVFAGYGHEDRIAFNRRFVMKNGQVKTWVGINHPDVVRVAGPIDPEIGLIRFNSLAENKPLSAIISYALHLDTLGGEKFSADYPFYLQRELSKQLGADFVSLFGSGTCGDINHVDTATKERNKTEEIGVLLAESVAKAMPTLKPVAKPSLAVKHKVIHVQKQQYSAEQIAQAKKDMDQVGDRGVSFPSRVEAYKIVALQDYVGETVPLEIHAFRLGPGLAIVTLPGEVFVELGLQIKLASPFKTTLVIELANDAPGYIPTKKAFVEGGYETINSRVASGGGEQMTEAAIGLLKELHESLRAEIHTEDSTLVEPRRLNKGSASQGLALTEDQHFTSNSRTICRFDSNWKLLQEKTIEVDGVNHIGAIDVHDGIIWAGLLHGPVNGKHDPKLDRSVIAKIRATDLEIIQTWDISKEVTWIDPVCFDGTHLWVGDLSDLGIHRYKVAKGELIRDGVLRYPKEMHFSQGIRVVGNKLYSIHTFGTMDGLFEFDLPSQLTDAVIEPTRRWEVEETQMHLEGFDFVPGHQDQIWHAQGSQVDRYKLKGLFAE